MASGKTPFGSLVGENCLHRRMEQMVARYAHNVEVGGPIPSPATKLSFSLWHNVQ